MGLKKSNAMLMMGLLPLMMHSNHGIDFTPNKWTKNIPKNPPPIPPAGTKEYFFNSLGDYSTEPMKSINFLTLK